MRWVLVLLTLASCAPPSTAPAEAAPVAVARAVELGPPRAPSPITGGTLAVTDDGALALAAEPDRDTVWLVSLRGALEVVGQVRLRPGDQPTRIALDSTGLAHVTLRGAAAVASFDPRHPERALRRSVCPAPTGIAVDEATLHVACAGGELVTLRPGAGSTTRRLRGDLRDVGVDAAGLWVSRFRSAELVRVSDLGAVSRAVPERLGPVADRDRLTFSARVAWRTIPDAERGHWMLHQWHLADPMPVADLEAQRRYYGDGVVKVGLTRFADGQAEPGHVFDALSMAVDAVALDPDRIAVAAAGRREVAVLYPATGRHNGFPSSVHGGGTPVAVAHHIMATQLRNSEKTPDLHDIGRSLPLIPYPSIGTAWIDCRDSRRQWQRTVELLVSPTSPRGKFLTPRTCWDRLFCRHPWIVCGAGFRLWVHPIAIWKPSVDMV